MPVLSYIHQLLNVDQCQAYIHTLRWKDRPLQCPRCQSHHVGLWGAYHYQPGLQRYRWKEQGCKPTFNDLTGTRLDGSKRAGMHWILATFLLCLSCSSRRIARELGVHMRTGYRWCWGLRNAALSSEMERQLEGTVEADELYHTAGQKGQAKQGGKKHLGRRPRGRRKKREPGRGHYDKDRPAIIAWVSRQGAVVMQATKDFTVKTVQKAADLAVHTGSRLYTDSASSYRTLKGYVHDYVNHTKKEYARGEVHENRAECLFSFLKPYLRVFRGVSKSSLPGYVGFFQFLRNFRQLNAFEQAELILRAALDPTIASRAKKGEFVTCFDHFDLLQTAIN
ncbi:MAG TPA: IS1595 family transposase [Candidatus Tectomicrobia bacterium]